MCALELDSWRQSNDSATIELTFGLAEVGQVDNKDIKLKLTKTSMRLTIVGRSSVYTYTLPRFYRAIEPSKTKSVRKRHSMIVVILKKEAVHWPSLEERLDECEFEEEEYRCDQDGKEGGLEEGEQRKLEDTGRPMRHSQSQLRLSGGKENSADHEDSIPRIRSPSKYSEGIAEQQADSFVHQVCNDFRELKINDIVTFENNKNVEDEDEQVSYIRDDTLHLSFDVLEVCKKRQVNSIDHFNESSQLLMMEADLNLKQLSSHKKPTLMETIGIQNVASSGKPQIKNPLKKLNSKMAIKYVDSTSKPKLTKVASGSITPDKQKPEIIHTVAKTSRESSKQLPKVQTDDRPKRPSVSKGRHDVVYDLLNIYRLGNIVQVKDLDGVISNINTSEMTLADESRLNEKILELVAVKITAEKGFRQHTEDQILKLTQQNKKQIDALQKMIKLSPRK